MAPTTCWNLRVSAEANQGGRKYMEDVTAVHFERTNGVEFASFAIFDGHGGREASHFAKVSHFYSKKRTFCQPYSIGSTPENYCGYCPGRPEKTENNIFLFHRIN